MGTNIRPPIERLLRGISTNHVETVRDAWRELIQIGAAAVPDVLDKLDTPAWGENPRGPLAEYLGILLALLDELDSLAFRAETDRLMDQKLHPLHRMTVELLAKRRSDQSAGRIGTGTSVYVSREISDSDVVMNSLEKWSQTEGVNLEHVVRIDVVARHPQLDYLGRYDLYGSNIILTWPTKLPGGLRLKYLKLDVESTFYHEVGHHVCGHTEGGQVEDQEREANEFARRLYRRAHPWLTRVGRVLLKPVAQIIRRQLVKTKSGRRYLRHNKSISLEAILR